MSCESPRPAHRIAAAGTWPAWFMTTSLKFLTVIDALVWN
jgi:hypothetical protein